MVRTKAENALGRIKSPDGVAVLVRALDADYDDPDPDVRKLVRWAIGRCRET